MQGAHWAVLLLLAGAATADLRSELLGDRPLTPRRIVTDILQYYQQDDPVGIPVLTVPEPLVLPNNVSITLVSLYGLEISGHSGFKLVHVNINVTSMTASILIRIPRLQVLSTYHYSSFFGSADGQMNLTFVGLEIKLEAELGSGYDSMLQLVNLQATITKEQFIPLFAGASTDLSLIVAAADTLFDTIVSSAVGSRIEGVQERVNTRLLTVLHGRRFPAGIHPVDLLLAGVKQDLKHKFDPLVLGPKIVPLPAGATLLVSNLTITGLSSLHRTHEVSVQLIDDRILLVLQVGTQLVSVSANIEVSASILPSLTSTVQFSIDSIAVWVEAQQSADVRHPPLLRRLHLTLGNFRLLSSGENTLSYILEAAVNVLPNALRNTIVAKVEPRLHQVIQRRLNTLDIEEIIQRRLDRMP